MVTATVQSHPSEQTILSGLARALVQHQRLRLEQAIALQKKANTEHTLFIDELIASSEISAADLARFASEAFGHPLFDLAAIDAANLPVDLIDRKLAAETRVVALGKRGSRLSVAVSDPTDLESLDRIKFQTQSQIDPIVVEHDKLVALAERLGRTISEQLSELMDDNLVHRNRRIGFVSP